MKHLGEEHRPGFKIFNEKKSLNYNLSTTIWKKSSFQLQPWSFQRNRRSSSTHTQFFHSSLLCVCVFLLPVSACWIESWDCFPKMEMWGENKGWFRSPPPSLPTQTSWSWLKAWESARLLRHTAVIIGTFASSQQQKASWEISRPRWNGGTIKEWNEFLNLKKEKCPKCPPSSQKNCCWVLLRSYEMKDTKTKKIHTLFTVELDTEIFLHFSIDCYDSTPI